MTDLCVRMVEMALARRPVGVPCVSDELGNRTPANANEYLSGRSKFRRTGGSAIGRDGCRLFLQC